MQYFKRQSSGVVLCVSLAECVTIRSLKPCEACKLPADCPAIVGMMLILIYEILEWKEII